MQAHDPEAQREGFKKSYSFAKKKIYLLVLDSSLGRLLNKHRQKYLFL